MNVTDSGLKFLQPITVTFELLSGAVTHSDYRKKWWWSESVTFTPILPLPKGTHRTATPKKSRGGSFLGRWFSPTSQNSRCLPNPPNDPNDYDDSILYLPPLFWLFWGYRDKYPLPEIHRIQNTLVKDSVSPGIDSPTLEQSRSCHALHTASTVLILSLLVYYDSVGKIFIHIIYLFEDFKILISNYIE